MTLSLEEKKDHLDKTKEVTIEDLTIIMTETTETTEITEMKDKDKLLGTNIEDRIKITIKTKTSKTTDKIIERDLMMINSTMIPEVTIKTIEGIISEKTKETTEEDTTIIKKVEEAITIVIREDTKEVTKVDKIEIKEETENERSYEF